MIKKIEEFLMKIDPTLSGKVLSQGGSSVYYELPNGEKEFLEDGEETRMIRLAIGRDDYKYLPWSEIKERISTILQKAQEEWDSGNAKSWKREGERVKILFWASYVQWIPVEGTPPCPPSYPNPPEIIKDWKEVMGWDDRSTQGGHQRKGWKRNPQTGECFWFTQRI